MSTLTDYRAALRLTLRDGVAAVWNDAQLDEALREALTQYSRSAPDPRSALLTLTAAGRELSLAGLTDLVEVSEVWLPAETVGPPHRRAFRRLSPTTLLIEDGTEPQAGGTARVFYLARHSMDGLDGATATSVPATGRVSLVMGAAALAWQARARQLAEAENVAPATRRWATEQAEAWLVRWRAELAAVAASQSGVVAWDVGRGA